MRRQALFDGQMRKMFSTCIRKIFILSREVFDPAGSGLCEIPCWGMGWAGSRILMKAFDYVERRNMALV
jgi:hypothetical protein